MQQKLGDRLKVKERRARGSRSAPVKVVGDVDEASTSNHQQVSKRKSSSSGVVMVESFAAAEEEELEKERSQPIISKTSNTTQDSGADVLSKNTRAKEMANRRRELEQSVARESINIRQRSEDRKHKSTKKETKEIGEKKKMRKSSRTVAEVKCRKETATELPAQEVNDRGKNSQLEDDATGGKGPVIDPGQGECEEEVEREEIVQLSRAKEMGKSNNHGEDTPTSAQAGVPIQLKSNEDDNGHLVPNLEFEETNDAMAITVKSKESNANSMSQSGQGRDPSNSPQQDDLMNQAEINVVDEQIGEQREANQDGQEEESFDRVVLSIDEAPG